MFSIFLKRNKLPPFPLLNLKLRPSKITQFNPNFNKKKIKLYLVTYISLFY